MQGEQRTCSETGFAVVYIGRRGRRFTAYIPGVLQVESPYIPGVLNVDGKRWVKYGTAIILMCVQFIFAATGSTIVTQDHTSTGSGVFGYFVVG